MDDKKPSIQVDGISSKVCKNGILYVGEDGPMERSELETLLVEYITHTGDTTVLDHSLVGAVHQLLKCYKPMVVGIHLNCSERTIYRLQKIPARQETPHLPPLIRELQRFCAKPHTLAAIRAWTVRQGHKRRLVDLIGWLNLLVDKGHLTLVRTGNQVTYLMPSIDVDPVEELTPDITPEITDENDR